MKRLAKEVFLYVPNSIIDHSTLAHGYVLIKSFTYAYLFEDKKILLEKKYININLGWAENAVVGTLTNQILKAVNSLTITIKVIQRVKNDGHKPLYGCWPIGPR